MTVTHSDDRRGFVATEPEPCHDGYRLSHPGQRYFLTIEQAVVCPDCVRAAGANRLSSSLTIEVVENRLLVRRGSDTVVVLSPEGCWLSQA